MSRNSHGAPFGELRSRRSTPSPRARAPRSFVGPERWHVFGLAFAHFVCSHCAPGFRSFHRRSTRASPSRRLPGFPNPSAAPPRARLRWAAAPPPHTRSAIRARTRAPPAGRASPPLRGRSAAPAALRADGARPAARRTGGSSVRARSAASSPASTAQLRLSAACTSGTSCPGARVSPAARARYGLEKLTCSARSEVTVMSEIAKSAPPRLPATRSVNGTTMTLTRPRPEMLRQRVCKPVLEAPDRMAWRSRPEPRVGNLGCRDGQRSRRARREGSCRIAASARHERAGEHHRHQRDACRSAQGRGAHARALYPASALAHQNKPPPRTGHCEPMRMPARAR